jgi:ATP synthase protein I
MMTDKNDPLARSAKRASQLEQHKIDHPEPSLGARLAQTGIVGWMVVTPTLLGAWLGRWLDQLALTGVLFSAALLLSGAALGFWSAWTWMHKT